MIVRISFFKNLKYWKKNNCSVRYLRKHRPLRKAPLTLQAILMQTFFGEIKEIIFMDVFNQSTPCVLRSHNM
jgi:hypothetical protein